MKLPGFVDTLGEGIVGVQMASQTKGRSQGTALPPRGFHEEIVGPPNRRGMEPVGVPLVLRLEPLETRDRAKSRDTVRGTATRSSAVEWTRNARACVTPTSFISQTHPVECSD